MWNASNLRTFCFKGHHYELFCLSRDSLSCATRSLDLFILFKFIFLYLWYIPPHSCAFHTFCLHQFFSYVYYHAEYFSFLWWCRWSEKARNLILILAVKSLTWSMFYFLTFVVLNFYKIYVLTCSNLPTKLQAICCLFYENWKNLNTLKSTSRRILTDILSRHSENSELKPNLSSKLFRVWSSLINAIKPW